jgi:hypothetical protein
VGELKQENNVALTAATAETHNRAGALMTYLGDVMKFEILLNEKSRVWIFHDHVLPARIAWVEFDPVSGRLELIPHDMRAGTIFYVDVPPALRGRMRTSDLVYFYLTEGDKVTSFLKVPVQIRRS